MRLRSVSETQSKKVNLKRSWLTCSYNEETHESVRDRAGDQSTGQKKTVWVRSQMLGRCWRANSGMGPYNSITLRKKIKTLEKNGALYRNPQAKSAIPALAVLKLGTTQLCFTLDVHGVNVITLVQSGILQLDFHLQQRSRSICFVKLDFCHGFCHNIQVIKGCDEHHDTHRHLSPTRTLRGGVDSPWYFHNVTREHFDGRMEKRVYWIDDYLIHEKSEEYLLN